MNSTKNILVAADSLDDFGGAEISSRDLIYLLSKNYKNIRFIASSSKKLRKNILKIHNKNFKGRFFSKPKNPKLLRNYRGILNIRSLIALKKEINFYKPDIIIFNNISDQISYSAILMAKFFKIRTLHIMRDTMGLTEGKFIYNNKKFPFKINFFFELRRSKFRFNPFKKFITKIVLNQVDELIAISNELKNFYEYNRVNVSHVVHNGIILKKPFQNNYLDSNENKKIIFWPSRYSDKKGGEIIIKAFDKLNDKNIDLVITASISDIKNKDIVNIINKNKNIKLTGWIPKEKIDEIMNQSTLVLYPSLYLEPFGRVPVEAMSFKKPVIVSNYGGLPEIVKNENNGYVIKSISVDKLLSKLKEIIYDDEKLNELGKKGFEIYLKNFTGDVMVAKYIKIIEN